MPIQERLEARIEASQTNMDTTQVRLEAGMKAIREKMETNQDKMDAWIEDMRAWRKEAMACQEITEAYPENMEASREEMESGVEHWEVPKEHAAVKPVGGLRKQHRGRHLATGYHGQPEERPRVNCISWKKLAAAGRRMTCRAGVAQRKGHGRNNIARRALKGQTNERGLWKGPECKGGVKDQGTR
jgi:hypothetical protein